MSKVHNRLKALNGSLGRTAAGAILLLLAFLTVQCCAAYAGYPSRAIEMVIAFPPGGVTDIVSRVFANDLAKVLKVPVVPNNRGGASGVLAASAVLRSGRDGYTCLASTISGMVLAPTILKNAGYDVEKDFIPVALISTIPDSVVVRPDSPYKTIQALVDAARKNPGKLSYASAGAGTDGHFNAEVLAAATGIRTKHVPFKGGGEVAMAVMGGHVDFGVGTSTNFFSLEQGRKLKALAITGKTRLATMPNVPTLEELGIRGDFIDGWVGFFVPAGTPKPIVDTLAEASEKVIKSPEVAARIQKLGALARYMSPSDFRALIRRDKGTAAKIAAKVGIAPR